MSKRRVGWRPCIARASAFAALALLTAPRLAAAQGAWTASLMVQPFPSPFIADWERNPLTAFLNVVYSGTAAQNGIHIEGYVRNAERGELARVASHQMSFGFGPVSQIFNSADILDWTTVSKNQQYSDLVVRTGMLPEGTFEMCADVISAASAVLAHACASFTIGLPDPPQLIFPLKGAVVPGLQPVFQWTPVRVPPEVGVTYHVRVVEVITGQLPEEAFAANPPWFESDVTGGVPMLAYPVDALPLDEQKQYAWRVEARDGSGNPLTRGGKTSEIWGFSLGGGARPPGQVAGGALPDSIELVPGVARVKGLQSATVVDGIASYVVNGKVTLEILAPTAFTVSVDAKDLAIDKISLQTTPRVMSGSVSGAVDPNALAALGGGFTRFGTIEYTPAGGVTMTASLALPGSDTVQLGGTVQVTAAGLYGSLDAQALPGKVLGSYGGDPARLTVQHARVEFPALTAELQGGVELFGKDVACGGVTATIDAQGVLGAQVSCTPRVPIGLVPTGNRAQLALLTLSGNFAFDGKANALTYDLHTDAQLRLDAGAGGANCGASLGLELKNGAVSVGQFTPRCDPSEGASSLGWLSTRLASLSLKKFAYAAGTGFDFELQVDLMPWVPDIPGFKLPAVTAVSITQNGLSVPSVDVAMTDPAFILAGFGVRVTRLRLPAFTLSWANWEMQSGSDFVFSFDAELSLPKLVGETACLTAQPITISNAQLAKGRFRMHLDDRTFTPACGVTLTAEASHTLSDIPLTEDTSAAVGVQQAGSTTGSGGCGGGTMASTVCKTLNQMGMGATDPCGNTIPDEWAAADKPDSGTTTWRKCGSGPWQKVEQPPAITNVPSTNQTPTQLDQAITQKEQDAAAAQARVDSALDDPNCAAPTLAADVRQKCDSSLAKARSAVDSSIHAVEQAMRDRYVAPYEKGYIECLGKAQQAESAGATSQGAFAGCASDAKLDTVATELKKLITAPPNLTAAQRRVWCKVTLPAGMRLNLGVARQRELSGMADSNTVADLVVPFSGCVTQADSDLKSYCDTTSTAPAATRARIEDAVRYFFGYERQQELLSQEPADVMGIMQQCQTKLAAAARAATTTSMLGPPGRPGLALAAAALARDAAADVVADGMVGGPYDGGAMPAAGAPAGQPVDAPTRDSTHGETAMSKAAATQTPEAGFQVRLELEHFGGDLDVGFYPFFVVNKIPEIQGNIVLPSIFQCTDSTGQKPPITTKLRLGPRGEVNASVQGFVPACPVDLAAVQVTVTRSELTFSTAEGQQSLVLAGGVSAKFTAGASTATGTGVIAVDLLHGKLLDGNVTFTGPFDFGLPREKPLVTFSLNSATLDTAGIHVDGRAALELGQGQTIGTTFDRVTINPVAAVITDGRVLFDASFGLEVGVAANGDLAWGATPTGAPLSVQSGVHIDLPSQITLSKTGFSVAGDGGARLLYEGRDVGNLVTKFSPGFALGVNPVGVASGMVDFQLGGVSMAYVDRTGFHPNLAYFASAILPAKLPLPSEQVAYLELRDASNNLRVSTENTGQGLRIYTAPGATVPLVLPALQAGRPTPPRIDVSLDLTLDPLGRNVSVGSIGANVPTSDLAAFDLSGYGLPFAVQTLAYDRAPGGAYQWTLAGPLMLFNRQTGANATDRIALSLDGSGRLSGTVNVSPNQQIPLVDGSQNVLLTLKTISGSFDANLPAQQLKFSLSAAAGLDVVLSAQDHYQAGATLTISDLGVQVGNVTYADSGGGGSNAFKYLDLSAVQLGLSNLRIPELSYAAGSGFTFRMLFDAALRFPSLKNLTLPPIKDIELTNSGFSIPAYEAPELHLGTAAALGDNATMTSDGPLDLGGFALNVKAFRMSRVEFNWFTGQAPADWGFGFDLELGLGSLVADAPQSLKDLRVQVLNAGLRNGRLYGTVERLALPTPLDIGVGKLYAISGSLPDPATTSASAPFSLTAEMDLSLGAILPVCAGGETQLAKANTTISIYGDGWFSGSIDGLAPNCPMDAGPFKFHFDQSKIVFGYGNATGASGTRTRSLELDVAGTVTFPGVTAGSTVTASGNVKFDLLQKKWIDGSIDVAQPFAYAAPDSNPYLAFAVDHARLDAAGLHFTGGGSLRAKDGASIGLQFNDFTLSLQDFQVSGGSVTFTSAFAVGVAIAPGGLQWGVYSPSAPRPDGNSFRFIVPQNVTLDGSGIAIAGTATAELAFSDKTFDTLQVAFVNGFKIGFKPIAVAAGRANFILGSDEIAHVDPTGFWPGNLFGVLPVPARLGLPSEDVAYLELRDAQNNLLIDMQTSATGIELRTKANTPVRLVVPGLAGTGGGGPPAVNVSFDVVVNPSNFQFVSGFVRAEAAEGTAALMSLDGLGVPLTLRRIAFENVGNAGYGLRLAGRFELPASLNDLKVDVPNLVVTAQGLTGDVQLGSYLPEYSGVNAPAAPLLDSASFMGDTLKIGVTGVKVHFGAGASFALKGQLTSLLFKKDGEDPAVLTWSGSVSPASGFSLQLDETQSTTLPIGLAQFEPKAIGSEPALLVSADAQEFKVRVSGVLTLPTVSNTLALTIAGLQVGTKGVVFPAMSIQGANGAQELDLFGAKFSLNDSLVGGNVVYPALKVSSEQGVFSVTLSGNVDFLDNVTRFWGLRVASNGQVALAGANLLDRPLEVVANYLSVDKATIANNALRVDLSVTLPSPLDGAGAQKVFFGIDANGQITGGTTLALINQQPSLQPSGSGPNTHFTFGVATVHLRYLALQLDFANLKANSSIQAVSDFYLQNNENNLIKLGDTNGGTVQPGLKIGFDGTVTFGTVALAREFSFDFDVVKLDITNVALPPVTNGFAIAISGKLGLDVSAVSGELDFQDFTVGSNGVTFSPSGLTGGELTIANVLHVQLSDIGYSGTPTTITIKGGGMPSAPAAGQQVGGTDPSEASKTVNVASFISFGGRISVLDVVNGGVQRFLFYKGTDGTTHLLIQQAAAKIMDIVDFTADFQYDETTTGFSMFLGGEGKIFSTYDVAIVGAFAQEASLTRAGMFVMLRGLSIQIGPYVVIQGLGGGFFLNPQPEWLEYVRQKAQVSQTAGQYIAAPAAAFTVLLFGEAGIIRPELVKGRILITVANTYFRMDGAVEVLSQGDRFTGDFHVQVSLTDTNIQGNIAFKLDYGGVVNGGGYLDIYVQSQSLWGVFGKSSAKIIAMLDGTAQVMIGPAGFYLDASVQMGYDVWIIKLTGVMDGKIWYLSASQDWGAYVTVGVEASVLGGLATAKGTLHGLILFEASPSLFAAASLQVSCPVGKWEGWAWVKFQNNQSSAGLGKDDALMDAIAQAENVANEMQGAKDQTQTAINSAKAVAPASVSLTTTELATAYKNIQAWDPKSFTWMLVVLEVNELNGEVKLSASAKQTEESYRGWYYGVLRRDGLPGDTDKVVQYTTSVNNSFSALEASRPQVESRIAALALSIQQLNPLSADAVAFSDPVRNASQPVFQSQTNPDGSVSQVLVSAPALDVDQATATAQTTTAKTAQQQIDANDLQVRQQIAALEAGLLNLRAVTTSSDAGALPAFVGQYAAVASQAERQFATQADVILGRQDWMRARLADLAAKDASVTAWVNGKTASLAASQAPGDYATLAAMTRERIQFLVAFSGNQQLLTDYDAKVATLTSANRWAFMTDQANTAGRQLFYEIANAGMTDADTKATTGFTTLASDAGTRLGTIRQAHASLSAALDALYQVQADATGALYDLYDRYLFLHSGAGASTQTTSTTTGTITLAGGLTAVGTKSGATTSTAAPTVDNIANVGFAQQRFSQLAQDLTVPKLNSVAVTAMNLSRYTAQLQFAWSGWHPSGTYEFRFRDFDPATGSAAPFVSNGGTGTLTSYRFTPDRNSATTTRRTFDVGARGGAGYTGFGRTSYTLSFLQGANSTAAVSGGALVTDSTPPSIPVVSFPGLGQRLNASGEMETWTSNPDQVTAAWTASDDESGIGEYQYALWSTVTGPTTKAGTAPLSGSTLVTQPISPEIRPFTSVGGRVQVNIDRLNLASGTPVYVAVKAKNGQNLTGDIGVSTVLRYDPTPPLWAAGGALSPIAPTIASAGSDRTFPACPVQQPPYPDGPLTAVVMPVLVAGTWSGSLATAPTGTPPRIGFNVPSATDAESGVYSYLYRVTAQPESTYTGSGWQTAGARTQNVVAQGDPLDYSSQFYIAIAARNFAGGVNTPLTYGPFRVQDPTPPSGAQLCAGVAGPGVLSVQITTDAKDDETGVTGYQYRVRLASTKGVSLLGGALRDYPATPASVDWTTGGSMVHNTAALKLTDGQQYYVDVRAVNGQGMTSAQAIAGPILYDVSPPPAPSATLSWGQALASGMQELVVSLTAPDDPHSGLTTLQYAVGTADTASDVIPWTSQAVVAGTSQLTLQIPSVRLNTTRYLRFRTVNGAGVPSVVATARISNPQVMTITMPLKLP